MALAVKEKYEDSRRLDHPDFADVAKTTYAKGVITDFLKVQDDPLVVKSLVKVDGGDYVPIFFQPKSQYWGDDARNYDSEQKNFVKAWMSFRGDDEVAVVSQENTPFAVLGMADGVPRIGEDVVKVETEETFYVRMSTAEEYGGGDKGPDGLSLGLELEAELIKTKDAPERDHDEKTIFYDQNHDTEVVETPVYVWTPFIHKIGTQKTYTIWGNWTYTNQTLKYTPRYIMHLIKIGPILYLTLIGSRVNWRTVNEDESGRTQGTWWYGATYEVSCQTYDIAVFPGWIWTHYDDCPALQTQMDIYIAALDAQFPQTWDEFDIDDYDDRILRSVEVYAAVYSDVLCNSIKTSPPDIDDNGNITPPSEFTKQTALTEFFEDKDVVMLEDGMVNFFTRPHTQAELQAAGMWPE